MGIAPKTITLSGWGQPHDALALLAPDATPIDYARHKNIADALAEIAASAADNVIGWSLGGQLAARAMAAGMFMPKKLILIAAPFQFVATPENPIGMKRDLYDKFRDNYARNPERTLHKAWELIHKGDTRHEHIRAHMDTYDKAAQLCKDWLRWLDRLDGFSFYPNYLADFPPTLLIHGDRDAVVEPAQSQRFVQAIPHARHMVMPGAGHAPHWHDSGYVKHLIAEHIHV